MRRVPRVLGLQGYLSLHVNTTLKLNREEALAEPRYLGQAGRLATSGLAEIFSGCFKISLNVFKNNERSVASRLSHAFSARFIFIPRAFGSRYFKSILRNLKTSRKRNYSSRLVAIVLHVYWTY